MLIETKPQPGYTTYTCSRCGSVKTLDDFSSQLAKKLKDAHLECSPTAYKAKHLPRAYRQ